MNKRWFLFAVFIIVTLGLVGGSTRVNSQTRIGQGTPDLKAPVVLADSLKLLSLSPASGLVVSKSGAVPPGPGNSVEATIEYVLVSKPKAQIAVYTAGEPGNPLHTGTNIPVTVMRGRGTVKTRFGVACNGPYPPPFHIIAIRYAMSDQTTAPATFLVDKMQTVDYNFMCRN